MSLRIRASWAVLVLFALCVCGAWTPASTQPADVSANADAVTVVYADVKGPADSVSLGDEADPEDADSMSAAPDVQATDGSSAISLISAERTRSTRPDRPPCLAHLG